MSIQGLSVYDLRTSAMLNKCIGPFPPRGTYWIIQTCPFKVSFCEDEHFSAASLFFKGDVLHLGNWVASPHGRFSFHASVEQEKSPWKGSWQQVMGHCGETGARDWLSVKWYRLACSMYLKGGVCHANEIQPGVRRCSECDSCLGVHDSFFFFLTEQC